MRIISHRGYWKTTDERNTEIAFIRSFELGFGTETDLRDLDGNIVISHDMPRHDAKPMKFDFLLSLYVDSGCSEILALNVKADGLQVKVQESLDKFGVRNYVLFDMSTPDLLVTQRAGLRYLTRMSDLEPTPALLQDAHGVWLDEFYEGWFDPSILFEVLETGKQPFIVSPELHGRLYEERWEMLKQFTNHDFVLCTDLPEQARVYFGG